MLLLQWEFVEDPPSSGTFSIKNGGTSVAQLLLFVDNMRIIQFLQVAYNAAGSPSTRPAQTTNVCASWPWFRQT
jgi:hypothetical protein